MKYLFSREDEAAKRLKSAYPDLVVHEHEVRGYYLDHMPVGFETVKTPYQLVGIKSEVAGFIDEDRTLPILFQDNDHYFMTVIVDHAFDWMPMINAHRIFVNHAIKKLGDG